MKQEYIETDRRRGPVSGRTWALMGLVAVITAIAIWLVPVDKEQALSLPPLPSTQDMTVAAPLSPATASPELESLPPPSIGIAATTSGGDRARTFIDELRADDMQPDADRAFAEAGSSILDDDHVDVGIIGCVPMTGSLTTLAKDSRHDEDINDPASVVCLLSKLKETSPKAWIAVVDGGPQYDPMANRLNEAGIPTFRRADRALRLFELYCANRLE